MRPRVRSWEAETRSWTGSRHYITNIESVVDGDTATVRTMFYNPMQLPGLAELSHPAMPYVRGAATGRL